MNFDSDTNVIEVAMRRLRAKMDDGFEPQADPDRARHGLCARSPGAWRRDRAPVADHPPDPALRPGVGPAAARHAGARPSRWTGISRPSICDTLQDKVELIQDSIGPLGLGVRPEAPARSWRCRTTRACSCASTMRPAACCMPAMASAFRPRRARLRAATPCRCSRPGARADGNSGPCPPRPHAIRDSRRSCASGSPSTSSIMRTSSPRCRRRSGSTRVWRPV